MSNTTDKQSEKNTEVELARMAKDIEYIKLSMEELKKLIAEVKDGYAKKEEFESLKRRVQHIEGNATWLVRIIIGAVIVAILSLVLITR